MCGSGVERRKDEVVGQGGRGGESGQGLLMLL